MTLYLPIVPSNIDGFECIPIKLYDDDTDPFAPQTAGENKFKFYYDLSLLNEDDDYTHVAIRFLSQDSNVDPLVNKYSAGVFISAKQSNSIGNYIEVPSHLFIQPANTVAVNNIRIDPSDSIPKIVAATSPSVIYRNINYQDYDLIKNSGINKFYRSQTKLLDLTSNNNLSYTASKWQVVSLAGTSVSSGSAIITVSTSSAILEGLNVSGNGVALGATVASISGTTITLSAASTQTTTSQVSFYIGQTFLNQEQSDNVSGWSYQTMMRPVFIPNLLGFTPEGKEYIGITDFKSRDTSSNALFSGSNTVSTEFYPFQFQYPLGGTEVVLVEYEFSLYDSSKNLIDSSGVLQAEKFLNQRTVTWTNSVSLVNNQTYFLSIYFKTNCGCRNIKRYQFVPSHEFATLGVTFNTTNDKDNGRIEFELTSVGTSSDSILLLRSSFEEGYDHFDVVALFNTQDLITTSSTRKYFYDYFVEPGMLYKYKFQSAESNSLGQIISRGVTLSSFATDLNGTSEYILANNTINNYPFTLEAWVNLDAVDTDKPILYISDTDSGVTDKFFGIKYINSGNRFGIEASNTTSYIVSGNTSPSVNTWYHLAAVFNSASERILYVNGLLEATDTASVAFNSASTNRVLMGIYTTNTSSNFLDGTLSDVRIWNSARTSQEIENNYQRRLLGVEQNLVDYWKLDSLTTGSVFLSGVPTSTLFPSVSLLPAAASSAIYTIFADSTINSNLGTASGATLVLDTPFTDAEIEIIPDFTGSFLCGKDDVQINFIHNGQISGFKQVKKDAILETIGGKYPFIIRNSSLGYKQFQFNALITFVSDPTRSLRGLTYTELLSKEKRDSESNYILPSSAQNRGADIRYEDFLLNGPQVQSSEASPYITLSNNGKNSINKNMYLNKNDNFIIEKQFRKKIIEWLTDGNPKIFKSDTEGLFLVKLTDVGFEPVNELGRTLYTFSCIMTEIAEINYENLVKYGLRKTKYDNSNLYYLSNINNFIAPWEAGTLFPQSQYFYVQDSNEFRYYKVTTTGTTGTAAPSASEIDTTATYTSSSGTYAYIFSGYSIPGKY